MARAVPAARWLALPLSLLLLAGPPARDARAITLVWKNAVSGDASLASNWQPSQVPGPADTPTFNVGGFYGVTFGAGVPSTNAHLYRTGNVTITTSGHAVAGTLRAGELAGDAAAFTLTTGTFSVGSTITAGNAAGSTGTILVNDDDADLLQGGTTADVVVGSQGTGTLQVTGGGLVDAADDVLAGAQAGSDGSVVVSGINVSPQLRSTLTSSGSDGDVVIASGGTADLSVASAGQVIAADDLRVGLFAGSQGSVVVEGANGGLASLLTVGDDLDIAENGVAANSGGTGSVLIQNSGQATVGGTTRVGDPDGGTGTLSVRATSFLSTRDLIVNDTHGVLDFQGGTIAVTGGVFDGPGTTLALDHPQFESLRLQNGATASFDGGSPSGYSVILGDGNSGGLRLESGAHLTHVNGVFSIGLAPGSNGTLDLTGEALLDGAGTIVVGQGGFGEVNLGGGADLDLTAMTVAFLPGSNGFVDVSGAGTTLLLESLNIGGLGSSVGGAAFVGVGNGGVIDMVGGAVAPLKLVHPGATLNVGAGGTVNGGNNLENRGRLVLAGGQVNTGSLNLQGEGELRGHGSVAGAIALGSPGSSIHNSGGTLTLGTSASNKGFVNSLGTLVVESIVTLLDLDAVDLGNVVLDGGSVNLPSGGGVIGAGRTLTGAGALNGVVTNQGLVAPGASAGALTIHGSYGQAAGGVLRMEIGDAATNQFDRIAVSSAVNLGGTLDVRLLPGHSPSPGEEFAILGCPARNGTFASVTFHGQPLNGQFTVLYNTNGVVLRVNDVTTAVPSPPGVDAPGDVVLAGRSGPDAAFELTLPEAARVTVRLYGLAGRFLGTLLDGERAAGRHRLRLAELGIEQSGVYFARAVVRSGGSELTRTAKVMLVR